MEEHEIAAAIRWMMVASAALALAATGLLIAGHIWWPRSSFA
jgi:hypothetical protein